jgi:hypothetical protein
MCCIRSRCRPSDCCAGIAEKPLDQRDRTRCCGDDLAWARPQAQTELQHIEGSVDMPPFSQFVTPCGVKLRPA